MLRIHLCKKVNFVKNVTYEVSSRQRRFAHVKGQKFSAHASCHMTCRQGVQNDHIFGIPETILSIHYTTFMGLRWRLRPFIGEIFIRSVLVENFCPFFGPIFDFGGIFQVIYIYIYIYICIYIYIYMHDILHRGSSQDVITCFKFCVDRLRGFGSARGQILPFSIDLAGRH